MAAANNNIWDKDSKLSLKQLVTEFNRAGRREDLQTMETTVDRISALYNWRDPARWEAFKEAQGFAESIVTVRVRVGA